MDMELEDMIIITTTMDTSMGIILLKTHRASLIE
jgi:hypothetical protein